ncbi:hypothetical protein GGR51DRAFT_114445 [Nemania sp. FL0031]|nr:hypothetical protein GGR51DRAFT_114445 [Nemania sp. FL0031]
MSPTSCFRFFDLPAELRTHILSNLLIFRDGIVLHHTIIYWPNSIYEKVTFLQIFLVNIQMYQEASAILYGQNHFVLNGQSHRLPGQLTKPGGFLSAQGQDARRRVQTLHLYLTRVGGEFENTLAPSISDMILSGSLRKLKIFLGPPNLPLRGVSHPNKDMMARPPFQALLNLLSDPDLRHVELYVWRIHWAVFCPFHKEIEATTKGETPRETVDGYGLTSVTNCNEWIQLDWKAMVNMFGISERIMKIKEADY